MFILLLGHVKEIGHYIGPECIIHPFNHRICIYVHYYNGQELTNLVKSAPLSSSATLKALG